MLQQRRGREAWLAELEVPLVKQVASAWHKVFRLSLPNGFLAETTLKNSPQQLTRLARMALNRAPAAPAMKALPAPG